MMQCAYVAALQLACLPVVSLSFLELAQLVPAECAIVVGLEVSLVKLNGTRVVLDRALILTLLPVSKTAVVVKVCIVRLKVDRLREGFDCFIEVTFTI